MSSDTQSLAGEFTYPPQRNSLVFNSIDSVAASWSTFDSNPTDCLLSLYYWPGSNPWRIGPNDTASANGTQIISLDIADGGYLGQLNFDYTASDGTHQQYLGDIFTVDASVQSGATTYSQSVTASSTSTASTTPKDFAQTSSQAPIPSSSATPAVSRVTITASITPPSALSTSAKSTISSSKSVLTPSSSNSSGLGAGAVAGIVVGAVLGAGLAAAFIVYRIRKSKNVKANVPATIPAYLQSPAYVKPVVEKYSTPSRQNELSADGQVLELGAGGR
ncbi:hypothetical protein BDR22DRAFT_827386 [Usnea florida]